jgi:hypothetical protein
MTEPAASGPRPVSLVTILAILGCFALFFVLVWLAYVPRPPAYIPEDEVAEKLSDDQKWQATPESRLAYLTDLRAQQEKQATSYGWVDQKNGVVQLPIDRAMELVVEQYGAKKGQP